jgi:F0F1-type ATP synthase membrane subunit b/b'
LDAARKSIETAEVRAREIRLQAVQIAEKESSEVRRQSKSDIVRLQESAQQAVQLERQRATKAVSRKVIDLALATTETVLLKTFGSKDSSRSKHKELNEIHIRETFRKLTKA